MGASHYVARLDERCLGGGPSPLAACGFQQHLGTVYLLKSLVLLFIHDTQYSAHCRLTMVDYAYSPLQASEIRLVRVQATDEDKLVANIEHVTLDPADPITYSALSYVWGNASDTVPLLCDGKTLNITTTLDEALKAVIKFNPTDCFWIDQICIDQTNLAERSEQVKKMNVIFEKAGTVVAWLGPEIPSTALAVEMISRVAEVARPTTTNMFRVEEYPEDGKRIEVYEKVTLEQSMELGIPFDDKDSWAAFSRFFDRPWFQRIWIVQEILQARKAIVLCGTNSLRWETLQAAAQWYHYKAAEISDSHRRSIDGIYLTVSMIIPWVSRSGSEYYAELLGQKTHPTFRWPLRKLLERLRPRLAVEAKDKVYALLGISELSNKHESDTVDFTVDYSQSLREVFALATKAMICSGDVNEDDLDIIMAARQRSEEEGWPSWVPDWRNDTGYGCEWGIGQPLPTAREDAASCQNGKYRALDSGSPFKLAVEGVVVGRATYTSPHKHVSPMLVERGIHECHDVCVGMLTSYPTGEDVEQAYALTLVAGELPEEMSSKGTSVETYAAKHIGWLDVILMPQNTQEDHRRRKEAAQEFQTWGFANSWTDRLLQAYCERRFYVTDTGYMGLGNHNMQEGDLIVVLFGLRVPCVLRPKGTDLNAGYEFVGEAYCQGLMNGEVIKTFGLTMGEDRIGLKGVEAADVVPSKEPPIVNDSLLSKQMLTAQGVHEDGEWLQGAAATMLVKASRDGPQAFKMGRERGEARGGCRLHLQEGKRREP
ncbi:hypothetical protein G7046_g2090 [Stylonectria norvegica]|nr:hypothetical protein G7046_g2090 [Stylonectria norvegica]